MKLMEMDAAYATQAMLSGKATVEEVAFLTEMVFAYAVDADVSNSDYHKLQRLTGGELSTETPICNR